MDTIMGTSTLEEIWEATEKSEVCQKRSGCDEEAVVSVLWTGCPCCPKRINYCLGHFVDFSTDVNGVPFEDGARRAFCSICFFVITMKSYYQIKR